MYYELHDFVFLSVTCECKFFNMKLHNAKLRNVAAGLHWQMKSRIKMQTMYLVIRQKLGAIS